MFARWCQENLFKYIREHYNIDRLIEHGCEPIPDTTRVVIRTGVPSTHRCAITTQNLTTSSPVLPR